MFLALVALPSWALPVRFIALEADGQVQVYSAANLAAAADCGVHITARGPGDGVLRLAGSDGRRWAVRYQAREASIEPGDYPGGTPHIDWLAYRAAPGALFADGGEACPVLPLMR